MLEEKQEQVVQENSTVVKTDHTTKKQKHQKQILKMKKCRTQIFSKNQN